MDKETLIGLHVLGIIVIIFMIIIEHSAQAKAEKEDEDL